MSMKIGIPKEIKNNENRVALPPAGVLDLVKNGHEVLVEKGAGAGAMFSDKAYEDAGAALTENPAKVWQSELVIKVKEPLPEEYHYFYEGLILFTYLHIAANKPLAEALTREKVTAIAYENVQLADGKLPLLTPMSEIAGRMAAQLGAHYLEKINGGKGILLSGVPGVKKGNVVIIGGGIAGTNAAKAAFGLGANVTLLDVSIPRLQELEDQFDGKIQTLFSNRYNLQETIKYADLLIGAVLMPGKKAPRLVDRSMVQTMPAGGVIIDIAIDQGGIFETGERTTSHDDPVYVEEEILHYAVPNMPGAVPQTATVALSNATLPYIKQLADQQLSALIENQALAKGVNTYKGYLTLKEAAEDLEMEYKTLEEIN
ncbi:alanine dehydrogenase [Enterococcus faecalis 13-SD-W-01]|nr:alanine dehydrogenase [Enterococcus faecalis 13-SD-W-01]